MECDVRQPHYQDLKERIHRALLNRLNLDRLNRVGRRRRPNPRSAPHHRAARRRESSNPLSLFEREDAHHRRLPRAVRPRPARGAAGRSDDLGHPRQPRRPDLRRARRQARADRRRLQGRSAPAAHHRAHRQLGGPPHRRVEPDGRRAARRRFACQRDHSAAGARRPGALHPPVPHRSPRRAGSGRAASR